MRMNPIPLPNAAAFIVTVYGDVAEPRGGELWMGSLIEICEAAGLSESLVRTSVSRLVAAGRLQGVKEGRRSYYRLTERAAEEFRVASRVIFGADGPALGLILVHCPSLDDANQLLKCGFARLGPAHLIGADNRARTDQRIFADAGARSNHCTMFNGDIVFQHCTFVHSRASGNAGSHNGLRSHCLGKEKPHGTRKRLVGLFTDQRNDISRQRLNIALGTDNRSRLVVRQSLNIFGIVDERETAGFRCFDRANRFDGDTRLALISQLTSHLLSNGAEGETFHCLKKGNNAGQLAHPLCKSRHMSDGFSEKYCWDD